ncbi:MAG: hypothetical protein HYZ09_03315 [Candidatus Kerfeldbacteria bacterium]|nr:hypothetical protein [Candidatus Kerfeldbacteria bacterium]
MRRSLFLILGLLLAYAGVVVFLLIPGWESAIETRDAIGFASYTRERQRQRAPADDQGQYAALTRTANLLEPYFINADEDVAFFDTLETRAQDFGVHVALQFLAEPQPGTPTLVPLHLTVTGPYEQILQFSGALESFRSLFIIQSFTLEPLAPAQGTVTATIKLNSLWK